MIRTDSTWTDGLKSCLPLEILDRIAAEPDLQPIDAYPLLWLARLAFKRQTYPGHGTLASLMGMPRTTLIASLKRLETAQVITTQPRGPATPKAYTLHGLFHDPAPHVDADEQRQPRLSGADSPPAEPCPQPTAPLSGADSHPVRSRQVRPLTAVHQNNESVNGRTTVPEAPQAPETTATAQKEANHAKEPEKVAHSGPLSHARPQIEPTPTTPALEPPRTQLDAVRDLVALATSIGWRTDRKIDPPRLIRQLIATDATIDDLDHVRHELVQQSNDILNLGAWCVALAIRFAAAHGDDLEEVDADVS